MKRIEETYVEFGKDGSSYRCEFVEWENGSADFVIWELDDDSDAVVKDVDHIDVTELCSFLDRWGEGLFGFLLRVLKYQARESGRKARRSKPDDFGPVGDRDWPEYVASKLKKPE